MLRSDRGSEAEAALKEVLAFDPASLESRLVLADMQSDRGDHEAALPLYKQVAEVATKIKNVAINGTKVELVASYVIDNQPGESTLTGELKGDELSGIYVTRGDGDPSQGTWTVKRS